MTREQERETVENARCGDMDAFERLVKENERLVYSLAFKMLGSQQDAEDAAQETFIKAFAALSGFRSDSKFSVWLYRLASNVCIDMLRKRKEGTVSLSLEDDEGGEMQLDIPDTRPTPDAELEKKELREAVNRGLQSLTYEYRQVLLLREIGGRSYDEISEILGLDIGTVKSRIFRARKKLCLILSADGNIFSEKASDNPEGGVRE